MSGVRIDAERIVAGEAPAIGRALNLIEDRRASSAIAIETLLTELGQRCVPCAGHRIGLTGPPGVGKSTLVAALTRAIRGRERRVGVVAVDPSSVRSGGALLGDRARMGFDPDDRGVFVRSLSTAGAPGGLSYAVPAAVEVLAAAFDTVLVETTGVGQTETDVEHVVDTVCLVIQPGSGDVLQFIKAGIMEIPDILVVNKADHGVLAQRAAADLAGALDSLRGVGVGGGSAWEVPVCLTSARDRDGIEALVDVLQTHRAFLADAGLRTRRHAGSVAWGTDLFRRAHGEYGVAHWGGRKGLAAQVAQGLSAGQSPPAVARALSAEFLGSLRL